MTGNKIVKRIAKEYMLDEQTGSIDIEANVTVENTARENWNYYGQLRFKIFLADNGSGEEFFIGDGGDTNWTQQLLSNKKERFMIGGLGSELFANESSKRVLQKLGMKYEGCLREHVRNCGEIN